MTKFHWTLTTLLVCAAIGMDAPSQVLRFKAHGAPGSIASSIETTGDFNNNGLVDIVFGTTVGGAQILLDAGSAGAAQLSALPTIVPSGGLPGGLYVSSVASGRIDANATLDLVVTGVDFLGATAVFVLLGNGNGTFQPPTTVALPAQTPGSTRVVIAAPFDSDPYADLLLVEDSASNPTSATCQLCANAWPAFPFVAATTIACRPPTVRAGDFDGDGVWDLAWLPPLTANLLHSVDVMTVNTAAGFGAIHSTSQPITSIVPTFGVTFVADMDGDGRHDFLTYRSAGQLNFAFVLANYGTTTGALLQTGQIVLPIPAGTPQSLRIETPRLDKSSSRDFACWRNPYCSGFGCTAPAPGFDARMATYPYAYASNVTDINLSAHPPAPTTRFVDIDLDGDDDLIGNDDTTGLAIYENFSEFGTACAGTVVPQLRVGSAFLGNVTFAFTVVAPPATPVVLALSTQATPIAGCGIQLSLAPGNLVLPSGGLGLGVTDASGNWTATIPLAGPIPIASVYYAQAAVLDPAGAFNAGGTNLALTAGRMIFFYL